MALALQERELQACTRVLGPEHPRTLTSTGNLAEAYSALVRAREGSGAAERLRLIPDSGGPRALTYSSTIILSQ